MCDLYTYKFIKLWKYCIHLWHLSVMNYQWDKGMLFMYRYIFTLSCIEKINYLFYFLLWFFGCHKFQTLLFLMIEIKYIYNNKIVGGILCLNPPPRNGNLCIASFYRGLSLLIFRNWLKRLLSRVTEYATLRLCPK